MFGKRAEPYEVLARFNDRVGAAYAAGDILPRTARVIAEATGATHVEIWLETAGELSRAATWPSDGIETGREWRGEDIRYQNEILGQIRVWTDVGSAAPARRGEAPPRPGVTDGARRQEPSAHE